MGLRQFNAHVAEASAQNFDGVSNVKRGESDGEFAFTYTNNGLASPLGIQVLNPSPDSYPESASFMVFTMSAHDDVNLERLIQKLPQSIQDKTVQEVIETIANILAAKLHGNAGDSVAEESSADERSSSGFDDQADSVIKDLEDELDFDEAPRPRPQLPRLSSTPPPRPLGFGRLKMDLKTAQDAGLTLGIYTSQEGVLESIFSLSLAASKLGIPDEAMKAWGLQPSDHLVLLIKLSKKYPNVHDYISGACDFGNRIRFAFGKCAEAKPSMAAVKLHFGRNYQNETLDSTNESNQTEGRGFSLLPLSSSIHNLLNERLPLLLAFRRNQAMSWDEAQEHYFRMERSENLGGAPTAASPITSWDTTDSIITKEVPSGLQQDHAQDDKDIFSIPLVAMQLALRRFARCTHYCAVCHCKVPGDFEALKPYVCSDPLCLYQYLTLGFSTSIEHEIVHSPYVVDLLVSFFFAAAINRKLREFPRGLQLETVSTGVLSRPNEHFVADARFDTLQLRFSTMDAVSHNFIKEGDWVLIVPNLPDPTPMMPITRGALERHMCRIASADANLFSFEIGTTSTCEYNVLPSDRPTQATHPWPTWTEVLVFRCNQDVDDADDLDRMEALGLLLHQIPPVSQMRQYLVQNPGKSLADYSRMNKSSLRLLRWIVASNRSYIVHDGDMSHESDKAQQLSTTTEDSLRISGLTGKWMKFYFAQGSPEKERQFCQALDLRSRGCTQSSSSVPTMFAWHGSPLGNWHSIIRTGLDCQQVNHGRAFGNGVYFSSSFSTSIHYSGSEHAPFWPNSALQVSGAISICEILNCPTDFVSTRPHYVVSQLDWIQCRYLLVRERSSNDTPALPVSTLARQNVPGYINQDPARPLMGPKGSRVLIPLAALPAGRRHGEAGQQPDNSTSKGIVSAENIPKTPDSGSMYDIGDDVDALMASEDEFKDIRNGGKRPRSTSDSDLETIPPPPKFMAVGNSLFQQHGRPSSDEPVREVTAFAPGRLDLTALPKLPEPTWMSSSPGALKRLNYEIRQLQKMQDGFPDLRDLGWYINFSEISNVFHWIVEFHSFDNSLPLAQDMKQRDCESIVLELRFGAGFPISPPFVRVIRPRFKLFSQGGGGHILAGGAVCSELLTNTGWSPVLSMDKVFIQVRLGLCDSERPARLETPRGGGSPQDYGIFEAVGAYKRAAASHGWSIPDDLKTYTDMWAGLGF